VEKLLDLEDQAAVARVRIESAIGGIHGLPGFRQWSWTNPASPAVSLSVLRHLQRIPANAPSSDARATNGYVTKLAGSGGDAVRHWFDALSKNPDAALEFSSSASFARGER
jgi:hypothetical protein